MKSDFRIVPHSDIDFELWDDCVRKYSDGHVYANSYYLNVVSPGWKALVYNDYEAVFPLTWRKKYGITYLFQPYFCQQLGFFGAQNLLPKVISEIDSKYRHINIQLNHTNDFSNPHEVRSNFVLDLNKSFEELFSNYSKQTKRNLTKASKLNFGVNFSLDPFKVVDEFIANKGNIVEGLSDKDYNGFKKLAIETENTKDNSVLSIVISKDDKILSSAIFFRTQTRLVLMMLSSSQEGMKTGASTLLVTKVIERCQNMSLILDFEGSQIEGLARFYSGFGAVNQAYPTYKKSLLPFL